MAESDLEVRVRLRDEATVNLRQLESGIIRFVGAVSAALASLRAITFPITAAAEFQKQLLDVAKTTEFTERQISQLSKGLIDLSKVINVSATDLAKIAEVGGQLGVGQEGVDALLIFTEAASRFSSVLEVSAEEAGNAIAKMSNIFKINIREAERISSTLNELANTSTASGADLIDIVNRIGTAGATLSFQQSAALAAVGRDLGLTLETIGTSFNKIFLDLQTKAPEVAQLIGMPVEEYTDLLRNDGIAALKAYLTALSQLPEAQRAGIAESLTGGGRIFALVTSLVSDAENNFALLDARLASANDGFRTGTSAIKEQQRVLQGAIAQFQILRNTLFALAEQIGRRALPFLTEFAKRLQAVAQNPEVIQWLEDFAARLGAVLVGIVRFIEAIGSNEAALGFLIRSLQILSTIKIIGFFGGIAKGALDAANNVKALSQQFLALARGEKVVVAAQKGARAADGAPQLSQAAARVGSALGSIFGPQLRNQKEIEDSTKAVIAANQQLLDVKTQIGVATAKEKADLKFIRDRERASLQRIRQNTNRSPAQRAADSVLAQKAAVVAAEKVRQQSAATLITLRDQEKSLKAQVREQGGVLNNAIALQNEVKPLPVLVGKVSAGFKSIRATILGLGGRLLSVLTGPLTFVVLTITSLLDLFGLLDPLVRGIGSAFGVVRGEGDKAAQAEKDRLTSLKETRESAASTAELFDQQFDKVQATKRALDAQADSAGRFGERVRLVTQQIDLLAGKMADLLFRQAESGSTIRAIELRREQLVRELAERRKNLEAIRQTNAELLAQGQSPATRRVFSSNVEIDEQKRLESEVSTLEKRLQSLDGARSRMTRGLGELQTEITKVQQLSVEAVTEMLVSFNQEGFDLARQQLDVIRFGEEAKKLQEELANLSRQGVSALDGEADLRDRYIEISQQLETVNADAEAAGASLTSSFKQATPAALAFMSALAPEGNLTNIKTLTQNIDTVAVATGQLSEEQIKRSEQSAEQLRIEEARLRSIEQRLLGIRSLSKEGSFATNLVQGEEEAAKGRERFIDKQSVGLRREAIEIQRRIAALKAAQDMYKRTADVASTSARRAAAIQRTEAQQTAGFYNRLLDAASLLPLVERQIAAQRKIQAAARTTAEVMKREFEKAQDDLLKVAEDNADRVVALSAFLRDRLDENNQDRFNRTDDRARDIENKRIELAVKEAEKLFKNQGLSTEEVELAVDAYRDQLSLQQESRIAERDRARAQNELNLNLQRGKEIQEEVEFLMQRIERLDRSRSAALNVNNTALAKTLTADITNAQREVSALNERFKEVTQTVVDLGSKNFGSLLAPETTPLLAEDKLREQVSLANELNTKVGQLKTDLAGAQAQATDSIAKTEETRLQDLQVEADRLNAVLKNTALALADDRVAVALRKMGEEAANNLPSFNELAAELDKISRAGINPERFTASLDTVSAKAREVSEELRRSAAEMTSPANLESFQATLEMMQQGIRNAGRQAGTQLQSEISNTTVRPDFAFDSLGPNLQTAIDAGGPYKIDLQPNIGGARAPVFAKGGPVSGPGTGTSDSIFAALSDGEYVMDSHTTNFFGAGFFRALQSISKYGRSALPAVLSGFGFNLPRYAVGGLVNASEPASTGGGSMDVMRIELAIPGGGTVSLMAERDQAQQLAKALKNIGRGVR